MEEKAKKRRKKSVKDWKLNGYGGEAYQICAFKMPASALYDYPSVQRLKVGNNFKKKKKKKRKKEQTNKIPEKAKQSKAKKKDRSRSSLFSSAG